MKRLLMVCAILTLSLLGFRIIAAEDKPLPNDPRVNPDANACSEGGSMEGKCGDSEYMWAGAWYKIRYEYGLIGRDKFPDQYKWMLPKLEDENADAGTCTVDIGSANAAGMGMSSSIVKIPLSVINGKSDPNASYGATPYGVDWYIGTTERVLNLYGPNVAASMILWYHDSIQEYWNVGLVSIKCPTPTPP